MNRTSLYHVPVTGRARRSPGRQVGSHSGFLAPPAAGWRRGPLSLRRGAKPPSASIAPRRGAFGRRWTSLTTREAPRPTIPGPQVSRPDGAIRVGEQRRKRRALPGRDQMTQCLEAGRLHVRAERGLPRRAAEGKRLVAQAVTLGEQQEGVGIDILDPDRRRAGARRALCARTRKNGSSKRSIAAILSPSGSVAITAPSSAPSRRRASRRSVRSSTRWRGVRGSAVNGVRQRDRQQIRRDSRDHAEP